MWNKRRFYKHLRDLWPVWSRIFQLWWWVPRVRELGACVSLTSAEDKETRQGLIIAHLKIKAARDNACRMGARVKSHGLEHQSSCSKAILLIERYGWIHHRMETSLGNKVRLTFGLEVSVNPFGLSWWISLKKGPWNEHTHSVNFSMGDKRRHTRICPHHRRSNLANDVDFRRISQQRRQQFTPLKF